MIFLPHELLESPVDSFLATFAAPSWNREWQCHNLLHSVEVRYFTHRQSAVQVTVPCTHYRTLDHKAISPTLFDIPRIVAGRTSYPSITLATVEPFNSLVAYSRGHTPNCHPWVICLIRWYFSSSASPIQVVWSTLSLRRLNPRRKLLLNPRMISRVVEPASNGLTASTQGFNYQP